MGGATEVNTMIDTQYENGAPKLTRIRPAPVPGNTESVSGTVWQGISILLCVALALTMILNTQMGGEAMWFWYGTAFRNGAKLYSQLHTALQPLFVLETGTWIRLFGSNLIVYEIPSLIHALLLAFAIYLVLRESNWPGWQKAIALLGTFVFTVAGHSYRFDDYHIVAELLITYALAVLLMLGRPAAVEDARRDRRLVVVLGVLCGLTIVTRVTDGAALITASVLSLPLLLKRRRAAGVAILLAVAMLTLIVVVKLTGDTLAAYASNSIFRAAGSKGGTGSIFRAPLMVIGNTLPLLASQKRVPLFLATLFAMAYAVDRYRPHLARYVIPLQFAFAGLMLLLASAPNWIDLKRGLLFEDLVLYLTLAMYLAAAYILLRLLRHTQGRGTWDAREILILVPILEWASYSAGAAAEPLTNYYAPVALLTLLIPVLQPLRRHADWITRTVVTIMALIAVNGIATKILIPYSWQNYGFPAMFVGRQWYHHPVYGKMYIDRDLLKFSEQVCADIGAQPGVNSPALLSLPYPFPNYFCATPPWHNYIQTFFDTATRSTIDQMMLQLQTAPPEWIVYQRQLNIMSGAERLYNHGQPLGQRYLDSFIAQKLASGEWKLVDHSDYLRPTKFGWIPGTGWYIIHTRP